jgi:hypothetical protein
MHPKRQSAMMVVEGTIAMVPLLESESGRKVPSENFRKYQTTLAFHSSLASDR